MRKLRNKIERKNGTAGIRTGVRSHEKYRIESRMYSEIGSIGGRDLPGCTGLVSSHLVGLCGHNSSTSTSLVPSLLPPFHPDSAAPLLALQTMLTVPAVY